MSRAALGPAALFANAADDEPVAGDAEMMLVGDLIAKLDELFVLELEQPITLGAVEMIVLRIAVVVFINGAAVEDKFAQESRIDEFRQRAINGRTADMARLPAGRQLLHELIGVEMLVPREDVLDQRQPLLRDPHAATLEEFDEPVAWREGDRNGAEGFIGCGHGSVAETAY